MVHPKPHPTTLGLIPEGSAGTKQTLGIMRRIVRRYKRYPPLRELALDIIDGLDGFNGRKNFSGQVKRLQNYVRNTIQYVRDVTDVETVQTPDYTLKKRAGDCDDQAVLLAALLESIGHPTRFVAIKTSPIGPYVHVYTETKIGARWVPVETTEAWPMGKPPPQAVQPMIVHNR